MDQQDENTKIEKVKKAKSWKLVITVTVVLIVIVVGTVLGVILTQDSRSSEEKIVDSLIETAYLDSGEYSQSMTINALGQQGEINPQNKLILSMVKDLNIKSTYRFNKQTEELEVFLDLNLRNINILQAQIYSNAEIIGINIPFLYDQVILMDWESLEEKTGLDRTEMLQSFQDMEKDLKEKNYEAIDEFDAKSYEAFLQDFIGTVLADAPIQKQLTVGDKKEDVTVYRLNSDQKVLSDFLEGFIQLLGQDEKLKAYLNEKGKEMLSIMNNVDFSKMQEYIYFTMVTEMQIDKKDVVRKSESTIQVILNGLLAEPVNAEIKLEMNAVKVNEKIDFDGMDVAKALNISDMTQEELNKLKQEMMENFNNQLNSNEIFGMLGDSINLDVLFNIGE